MLFFVKNSVLAGQVGFLGTDGLKCQRVTAQVEYNLLSLISFLLLHHEANWQIHRGVTDPGGHETAREGCSFQFAWSGDEQLQKAAHGPP
jgi:hypothetical protein